MFNLLSLWVLLSASLSDWLVGCLVGLAVWLAGWADGYLGDISSLVVLYVYGNYRDY